MTTFEKKAKIAAQQEFYKKHAKDFEKRVAVIKEEVVIDRKDAGLVLTRKV